MIAIRPFRPEDAEQLAEVFEDAVGGLGPADYTTVQVGAWLARAPDPVEIRARCADGRLTLVAVRTNAADDEGPGRVLAFIDLEEDGHIDLLYARAEVAGQGVAKALYAELEEIARARGLGRLHTEASEAARRFFLGQGFSVLRRRDFEISGVPIHNYAMEKQL